MEKSHDKSLKAQTQIRSAFKRDQTYFHQIKKCIEVYMDYRSAKADWDEYQQSIEGYKRIFFGIIEKLQLIVGSAWYCDAEEMKVIYGSKLKNAKSSLRLEFDQFDGSIRNGILIWKRKEIKKEKTKKLMLPKLEEPEFFITETGENGSIVYVTKKRKDGSYARRFRDLSEILSEYQKNQEKFGNQLYELEKEYSNAAKVLKRQCFDVKRHIVLRDVVIGIYPIVEEILATEDGEWEKLRQQGLRIAELWKNCSDNDLCWMFYEDVAVTENRKKDFVRAERYESPCPALYWRTDKGENNTVYELILKGKYK